MMLSSFSMTLLLMALSSAEQAPNPSIEASCATASCQATRTQSLLQARSVRSHQAKALIEDSPLASTLVGTLAMNISAPHIISGTNLIVAVTSGTFEGEGISGHVVGPAADWITVDPPSGTGTMSIRITLKMDDDSLVQIEGAGRAAYGANGVPEYLVATPLFSTTSTKYGFLVRHAYVARWADLQAPTAEGDGRLVYKIFRIDLSSAGNGLTPVAGMEKKTDSQTAQHSLTAVGTTGTLASTAVGTLAMSISAPLIISGTNLIVSVTSGTFEGEGISGDVVGPAADWITVDPSSGTGTMSIRITLKMDDDSLVQIEGTGRAAYAANGAPEYLVATPLFSTTSTKYGFLVRHAYAAVFSDLQAPTAEVDGRLVYKIFRID